jgi:hypothetical protein
VRRALPAALLGLSLATPSFSANGPGTTAAPFLKIPISGRAAALAGTLGGDNGDIANLDYNPAAINGVDRVDIMATYVSYLEQTSLQSASVGFPVNLASTPPPHEVMQGAEFTPQQLQVGFEYRQFKADDTSRSAVLGAKGDDFSIRSQLFELAFAYPITSRIGIGAAGKMISDGVENKTAKSTAGDIGLTAKLSSRWTAAVAIQNFGSSGKFENESDPLPRQARGSLSYNGGSCLVLADVAAGADGLVRTAAGLEWSLGSIVRLRAGAYHDTDLEFSGGLGLRLHGPQKARHSSMRPPAANTSAATALTVIAQSLIEKSATKLIDAAVDSKLLTSPSPIAIYPLNSKENANAGASLSDAYAANFKRSKDFAVLGASNRDHSDTMLVGNIEDEGDAFRVNTRLVMADTADTIATDHFMIAKEDLYVRKKNTLDTTPTTSPSSSSAESTFSTLDLGLDYGLQTSKDLGLTHTISLKLLY